MQVKTLTFETPNRYWTWTLMLSEDDIVLARIDSVRSFPTRAESDADLVLFLEKLKSGLTL